MLESCTNPLFLVINEFLIQFGFNELDREYCPLFVSCFYPRPKLSSQRLLFLDPFTERKASWVIGAKFVCSNACFKKLFHASHLGVPSNSASYSLKISSKLMETTQHLPEKQGFEILIAFSAWTVLNLCASFTNCALLRVSYSITRLITMSPKNRYPKRDYFTKPRPLILGLIILRHFS